MGRLLEVTCRKCAVVTQQLEGPVMSGFLPRCLLCGRTRSVTIEDLMADESPDLDPASQQAREQRRRRVPELAGTCVCGGTFAEDAPVRCRACSSADVGTAHLGSAD